MAVKKRYTIDDIITAYERKQQGVIRSIVIQIMALMDKEVNSLAFQYAKRKLIGNRFLPKDIRNAIDRITNTITAKTRVIIIRGIQQSFLNSEEKNDKIKARVLGSGRRVPPRKMSAILGSPKGKDEVYTAVDAYVKRKKAGLGLSKRIWKLSPAFKKSVNDTMIEGLKEGTSTKGKDNLGQQLRKSLRRNEVIENPGRGVYKNPQKNAERVARTEINMAYNHADYVRWNSEWFITGMKVKLSNSHLTYDICDSLQGDYPKDFHFTLWHPNCKCISIPILVDQATRGQYMDWRLGLRDEPPKIKYIDHLPAEATQWMKQNKSRVNGWKNTPYWLAANPKRLSSIFAQ